MTTKAPAKEPTKDVQTLHWDPFRDMRAMTDILGDMFSPTRMLSAARDWTPSADIRERDGEYVITACLPGVKKEDVKVEVENGLLTISGERKTEREEKDKAWLRRETTYGAFSRTFILPEGVHPEDVKAVQKDGILTVTLPKPEKPRRRGIGVKVE